MAKTLCKWDEKRIDERFNTLLKIVAKPRFSCRNCARVARKKKHLCKPRRMPTGDMAGRK